MSTTGLHTHVRINPDMLRTRRREALLFQACLEGGTGCVIDNTNITRDIRRGYIMAARECDARVIGYCFAWSVSAGPARNGLRSGKSRIPDMGLLATYNRLELSEVAEGFDKLFYVRAGFNIVFAYSQSDENAK